MSDAYLTIDVLSKGMYKEKGSKFPAYLFPVLSLKDFESMLAQVKKEHIKARHFCYAYRIGYENEEFRYNDDGEPSGTAGKPIFGQLVKADLSFVGAIVVRYFGGTKLGTSGLIKAYKEATLDSITAAQVISKTRMRSISIQFDYAIMGKVMQTLKQMKQEVYTTDFGNSPNLEILVPFSEYTKRVYQFKAQFLGRSVEDIDDETTLEQCFIE